MEMYKVQKTIVNSSDSFGDIQFYPHHKHAGHDPSLYLSMSQECVSQSATFLTLLTQ